MNGNLTTENLVTDLEVSQVSVISIFFFQRESSFFEVVKTLAVKSQDLPRFNSFLSKHAFERGDFNNSKEFKIFDGAFDMPGVHDKNLKYLPRLVKQEREKGKKFVFHSIFDKVHIKAHIQYHIQTHETEFMLNSVVICQGFNKADANNPLAKKTFVFMLVGVNGIFKMPSSDYTCF